LISRIRRNVSEPDEIGSVIPAAVKRCGRIQFNYDPVWLSATFYEATEYWLNMRALKGITKDEAAERCKWGVFALDCPER